MPNWCENDLTVEGPKEVIEEFLRFAAGESPLLFNRFLPYPEEFQFGRMMRPRLGTRSTPSSPITIGERRPKDGFNSGGYEWRVTNWGTKWPAFHVDVEGPVTGYDGKTLEVVFHFDTAWSPLRRRLSRYAAERFTVRSLRARGTSSAAAFQRAVSLQPGRLSEPTQSGEYHRRPRRIEPRLVSLRESRRRLKPGDTP